MIIPIRLKLSNAYLIAGDRPVLVDTGSPGETNKIAQALAQAGVALPDLALIVHTHGHGDHAGSTRELQQRSGAPVAIHPADGELLRLGHKAPLTPTRFTGRVMRPLVNMPFAGVEADLWLEDGQSLAAYGVPGRVIHTPGHTAGSISLLLDNGQAIIGDLLMGGMMGGAFRPTRPGYHYFANDLTQVQQSIHHLLSYNPTRLYVGHGGPLPPDAVRQFMTIQSPVLSYG